VNRGRLALGLLLAALAPPAAAQTAFTGSVRDAGGAPIAGAMVTFSAGSPAHHVTVFSGDDGAFRAAELGAGPFDVRARRLGWRDTWKQGVGAGDGLLELVLERETDPIGLAAQLPANHWYARVLARIPDDAARWQLKRECTFCHQQGNPITRRPRTREEWEKIIALMGRMGAMLPADLRRELPDLFIAAYDPATAVPELTAGLGTSALATPPPAEVRRARIEEWDLGSRASMQHDVIVHPDGTIYSVDGSQDRLYRLDPSVPGGRREFWDVPSGDRAQGGIFASERRRETSTSQARVGPHSLQVAPDGAVWITLAIGNGLARFDPATRTFEVHEVATGFYPHTLRFDARGRFWYTMAASNHVGMFDPQTGEQRHVRLPARTWKQAAVLRLMPFFLWLDRKTDLRERNAEGGDGFTMPVPYGIDIAPDGGVWFSQLNENRIGRIDPESLGVELFETPFPAPRRLRFDSKGILWVPSFSAALLAAFDPRTGEYRSWELPIEPRGSESPYALAVDRRTDAVWICGTTSDTLLRFEPRTERFTVYPLPTRVTYTRDLDFDAQGRVWTSNSNSPAWQIEGGQPRVIRLTPGPAGPGASEARATRTSRGSAALRAAQRRGSRR
jgi:streptogramin lyase